MSATWQQLQPATRLAQLIGDSAATRGVRALIDRAAQSNASVLVTGPSGSGKEVVAQLLHQRGPRAAEPFVAVNCAAIPRELIESEIFGHEAGAFTGAARARRGRFEAADRGTLFLDEIGDMPCDMQVKLLRILETRVVERVGSVIGVPVDVRLVAATNVELDAAIADGRFREDLFYRLNVVEIRLTPLAERREDIPQLLAYFAATAGDLTADARVHFTAAATAWLSGQTWRGNVRELRNFVDRAAALYAGESIDRDLAERLMNGVGVAGRSQSIDRWLQMPPAPTAPLPRETSSTITRAPVDLKALLDRIEQSYIEQALDRAAGAVAETARLLGLRRTTLIEKMRRLNIQRPQPG